MQCPPTPTFLNDYLGGGEIIVVIIQDCLSVSAFAVKSCCSHNLESCTEFDVLCGRLLGTVELLAVGCHGQDQRVRAVGGRIAGTTRVVGNLAHASNLLGPGGVDTSSGGRGCFGHGGEERQF